MSPEQFIVHLRQLGISQVQLARHFGLSAVTVSRWANGHSSIPGSARRWLELALSVKDASHVIPVKARSRGISPS